MSGVPAHWEKNNVCLIFVKFLRDNKVIKENGEFLFSFCSDIFPEEKCHTHLIT